MSVSEETIQRVISEYYAALGRIGGSRTSEKKTRAAVENGKKGGRPRKDGLNPNRSEYAKPDALEKQPSPDSTAAISSSKFSRCDQVVGQDCHECSKALLETNDSNNNSQKKLYSKESALPIKLAIISGRERVGKTTTAITLARCFADRGFRVLLIDADPEGRIAKILGVCPNAYLYDFLIAGFALRHSITPVYSEPGGGKIDLIAASRLSLAAEFRVENMHVGERIFNFALKDHEREYDAILIDVSSSISMFQACAMCYTQQLLLRVEMDLLAVTGIAGVLGSRRIESCAWVQPSQHIGHRTGECATSGHLAHEIRLPARSYPAGNEVVAPDRKQHSSRYPQSDSHRSSGRPREPGQRIFG